MSALQSGSGGLSGSTHPHTHTFTTSRKPVPNGYWRCQVCGTDVQNGWSHHCSGAGSMAPSTWIGPNSNLPAMSQYCSACGMYCSSNTIHQCYATMPHAVPGIGTSPTPMWGDDSAKIKALESQVANLTMMLNTLSIQLAELQKLLDRTFGHIIR